MANQAQGFTASVSSAEVAVQPPPVMYHLRPALALHHRHAKEERIEEQAAEALLNEALMMTALGAADDEGPEPVE